MAQALTKPAYQELLSDISKIYESSKQQVNKILISAYWQIGRRIVKVEQNNKLRAKYGSGLLEQLSEDLTERHGNGFSPTNLRYMRQFFLAYPIRHPCDELGWAHYRSLLTIKEKGRRASYEQKVIKNRWSVRDLREKLANDKIERLPRIKAETAPKLSYKQGRLFTFTLISPKIKRGGEEVLCVDCGFNVWRQIPLKGLSQPKAGDIVESKATEDGFTFKRSEAKPSELFTFKAYVERVVDGDTIWCEVDLGFNTVIRQKLRLRGIDAPELKTAKGQKAKAFVEKVLKNASPVIIKTHKPDKFDRYLTDVWYGEEEEYLNQRLLDQSLAQVVK